MARQDADHAGHPGLITDGRRAALVGAAAAGIGSIVLVALDPFADRGIGCPLHELTGLDCPGCGVTRAAYLLLHGDLAGAARHNLLFLPLAVWVAGWWVHRVWPAATGWLSGWARPLGQRPAGVRYALFALVVVFTVARNLPALELLSPPDLASYTPSLAATAARTTDATGSASSRRQMSRWGCQGSDLFHSSSLPSTPDTCSPAARATAAGAAESHSYWPPAWAYTSASPRTTAMALAPAEPIGMSSAPRDSAASNVAGCGRLRLTTKRTAAPSSAGGSTGGDAVE